MKRLFIFTLTAIFLIAPLTFVFPAFALEDRTVSVVDFGAVPNDNNDDRAGFNSAFDVARSIDGVLTVVVPPGEYHLSSSIRAFSNTTVLAEGATIIADYDEGNMFHVSHLNDEGKACSGPTCPHGGYDKFENITIDGGVWMRNYTLFEEKLGNSSIFSLRHGKNITLRNLEMKNATNHMLNLSSSSNILVENVTFSDSQMCNDIENVFWSGKTELDRTRLNAVEVIHLDICNGEGESNEGAMPLDGTPVRNVTIKDCLFDNIFAGIGNHHHPPGEKNGNITVENCTFRDLVGPCVNCYSFDGVEIKNCRAENVPQLALIYKSKNILLNGNEIDSKLIGETIRPSIKITESESINVENNILKNSRDLGIQVNDSTGIVISSNNIDVTKRHGFYFQRSSVEATGNTLSAIEGFGMACDGGGVYTISENTVNGTTRSGIYVKETNDPKIISNTVTASEHGIYLSNLSGAEVRSNTVNSVRSGVIVYGESAEKPCSARIVNNDLRSSGENDLWLYQYAVDCYLSGNVLENCKFRVHDTASYTGSVDLPVLETVTLSQSRYTYDGSEKKPTVSVKDSFGRTLTEGTHYAVSFSGDCINAGEKTVKVSGKGVFKGQVITKTFTISPKPITPTVKLSKSSYAYDGTVKTPTVTVSDGETVFDSSAYSVSYDSGRKNAGAYKVTVTMKKNYSGSATAKFKIKPIAITPTVVLSTTSYVYNGSQKTPGVKVFNGETQLSSSTYTVTYDKGRTNVGTYKVLVTMTGNYSGSGEASFKITKKAATPKVTLAKTSYPYNGKERKPAVTVTVGGVKLASSQYKVTYPSGMKNVGTYTVKVTLKGNYSGSGKASFKIVKASQSITVTKAKTPTVKYSKTKATTLSRDKLFTVKNAKGTVKYSKASGSSYLSVNSKTGAVMIAKKAPKGTYTLKVKISAAGNSGYNAASQTVSVKIIIK